MRRDPITGRFLRTSKDVSVQCVCGEIFMTTTAKQKAGRGKYCSRSCLFSNRPTGEDAFGWKGDDVGYHGIHDWIAKERGRPQECQKCGTNDGKRYEWANVSGEYKRELSDWARLCKKCHNHFDDVTNRGWQTRRSHG